jgi:hypothetical protein
MSYQKKKLKKNLAGRIRYRFGLAKVALLKSIRKVARRNEMFLPQTRTVMSWLRNRKTVIRSNNVNISEQVDGYINRCILQGKPVEMLTQFCISKDLEVRYRNEGDAFVPTRKERLLFEKEIPLVADAFGRNGITFNWWITFNQSYLDSGRISPDIQRSYTDMIRALADPLVQKGWLMLADWETEVLGKRPEPNAAVLTDIGRFVKPESLELEIKRHSSWAREEAGLTQSDAELKRDVCFQIACEAEEGRYVTTDAPFGECILIPLESPERYDFFTLLVPDFKKRIVAVLPTYPWRMKDAA